MDLNGILLLILFSPVYLEKMFLLGVFYAFFFNSLIYEPSRRLVVRMDLLPDSETVHIQKIGFCGTIYGQSVKLDDFERIDLTDEYKNSGESF